MGFGKDGKGVIFRQSDQIVLSTLAAKSMLKQTNDPALTDSFRLIKSEGSASLQGATKVEGDGPVELWLVSDELSIAEIVETIGSLAGQPKSREAIVENEQAMRPVFYLGMMEFAPIGIGGKTWLEWSKVIRWTFGDGQSFILGAWNAGTGALTTGASLNFRHTAYGVWVGA